MLSGCGFHLQGAASTPEEMQRTYISTTDEFSLFYRELRRTLKAAGVEVLDSPESASATLTILYDFTDQRVLSVSARNVPTEFEVFYSVVYGVSTTEAALLATRSQTITRDYTWDETQVLGKEREEEMLREAIADDLVRVILIQLSGI